MTTLSDGQYMRTLAETLDALPEQVVRYRLPRSHASCTATRRGRLGTTVEPADVVGRPLDEFLSADGHAGLMAQLARLGPDNPVTADAVIREAPKWPGQWVEWVDRYMPGPTGDEVLAVGRDVTARHIAESKLAESESRFRDLADKSADVMWRFVLQPHPHFDYMSPSVAERSRLSAVVLPRRLHRVPRRSSRTRTVP